MGVEPLQAGRAIFQAIFLELLHTVGKSDAFAIPVLLGPLH
jgi:hypothetical protein